MPRLVGVDIPNNKRVVIALTYIYGIGPTAAVGICQVLDLDPDKVAREMTEDELSRVASYVERNMIVEGELRRLEASNISRLRQIGCYRGMRHRRGLPVRGQRTRTNARTRKGKKRTVAGKKGVKEMAH